MLSDSYLLFYLGVRSAVEGRRMEWEPLGLLSCVVAPPFFFFNPGSAVGRLVESRNQEERPGPSFLLVELC